jgi:4-amino-4-deoxy-L-arabinose transferase-like glycosyltransferase
MGALLEAIMSLVKHSASHFWLLAISAIAVAIRCVRPGLAIVIWDEINLLFWSSRIAHYGEWIWLSNNWIAWTVDWNPLTNHSPLNNYLLAIPYLITADPIFVRFVVQFMGAASVVILYVLVKRYFGIFPAVISGLTLALLPFGVDNVRHVSNPNLAPLFIALYLLTGLLGYYENKVWGRLLHWIFLGVAAQNHPANALLALPSAVLLAHNLWFQQANRRAVVVQTAIGIFAAAVTFAPWAIGVFGGEAFRASIMRVGTTRTPSEFAHAFTLSDVVEQLSRIASGTSFDTIRRATTYESWWPPSDFDSILWIHTNTVLVGCALILLYAFQRLKERLPHLFVVSTVVLPLVVANLISPGSVQDFYLLSIQFGTATVWGIALATVYQWKLIGRFLALTAASVILILFAWLNIGKLHWLDRYGWEQKLRAPMEVLIDQANQWSQKAKDVVFLVDSFDEKYSTVDSQRYFWTVIGQHIPIRVVNRMSGEGIPISRQGTLLASFADGQTIPAYFGSGTPSGATSLSSDHPIFLTTVVFPVLPERWDFSPQGTGQFDNGARILGIDGFEAQPNAEVACFKLYWTPTRGAPLKDYHFSVRLIVENGRKIGQLDSASLSRELWQNDDVIVSPFCISTSEPVENIQLLHVQVLMYTYPDIQNANVVDGVGNPISQWIFLYPSHSNN